MKVFLRDFIYHCRLSRNASGQQTDSFDKLGSDFWSWRARYAPFTGDDVNRIERPGGMRDWSRAKIDSERKDWANLKRAGRKLIRTRADRQASRLPIDWLGFGAGALGAGH